MLVLDAVYVALLILAAPWWLGRLWRGKGREQFWSRLVGAPPMLADTRPVVWIHAVSVGEVQLLRPILDWLRRDRPDLQPILSVTTAAGLTLAEQRYPDCTRFPAPLDFSWAVNRVFARLQPRLLILAELELWPNLLLAARREEVPVAVINARMSERSFRGYRRARWLLRPILASIRWWGAQTREYADRIATLTGPLGGMVTVTGSLKYEGALRAIDQRRTTALRQWCGFSAHHRVWVAGSTHSPEEAMVLTVFARLRMRYPELRLLLAPRHPERGDEVAKLIADHGLTHQRRSLADQPSQSPDVILLDTVGELGAAWGLAEFGYVGGTMGCRRGGQSMIEPAAHGVPACFGPETWNFRDTVEQLRGRSAAVEIPNAAALEPTMARWLEEPTEARTMGERARAFIAEQQGAVAVTTAALERLALAAKLRAVPT